MISMHVQRRNVEKKFKAQDLLSSKQLIFSKKEEYSLFIEAETKGENSMEIISYRKENNALRSESRCALGLRYVDTVVSIEASVEVCCCFTVFSC
jgi:hypothetical protein